jgi:DivIVA domain-containing protein
MLTPQAIKDQDFQIKFRGYDSIEVKAYLELLAEDFFELTEQNRLQAEELESLKTEVEFLQREKESLAAEVRLGRENAENVQGTIDEGFRLRDEEIAILKAAMEEAAAARTALEEENLSLRENLRQLQETLDSDSAGSRQDQSEVEKLRGRVALLEEQNAELKQQGLDFKTTILAAQKFADTLRSTSEEEARQIMEKARADVERFRNEANAELERLPREIERLHKERLRVRDELKAMLHSYLEALDVFPDKDAATRDDDLSDLFESILLPEDESGESTAAEDLGKIKMDLE